jgi:hypothetical protein
MQHQYADICCRCPVGSSLAGSLLLPKRLLADKGLSTQTCVHAVRSLCHCVMHGSREALPCLTVNSRAPSAGKDPRLGQQRFCSRQAYYKPPEQLRTSRENALSVKREVSASAGCMASVTQPDLSHYSSSPERIGTRPSEPKSASTPCQVMCVEWDAVRRKRPLYSCPSLTLSLTDAVRVRCATLKVSCPGPGLRCFYLMGPSTQSIDAWEYVEPSCSRLRLHVRIFPSLAEFDIEMSAAVV